jgi:hypothetical protein
MRASMIVAIAFSAGCASPAYDAGQAARSERPPPGACGPAVENMHTATTGAPAPRLRETKSLGYAGDGKLTEIPPRRAEGAPSADERAGPAPQGPPPIVVYGTAPYGAAPPPRSTPPPQAPPASPFYWTQATAPGGSMPAATPIAPAPSLPFAPK